MKKAVITAAGGGSRLLPITKEIPKEMLPIVVKSGQRILLKPMLQGVFEQIYGIGVRDFCFIVGRGKRSIEDHFDPDWALLQKVKESLSRSDLESFFEELDRSTIYFVNQSRRKGFGDAVLCAEDFVGDDPFLVHAGDDLILSKHGSPLSALANVYFEKSADAVLLVEEVDDPRGYGVVTGVSLSENLMSVTSIQEKPERPKSHLAVIATYVFSPRIFDVLRASKPDAEGELQLTSAIQKVVDGKKVFAIILGPGDTRIDIGNPDSYVRAISRTLELG